MATVVFALCVASSARAEDTSEREWTSRGHLTLGAGLIEVRGFVDPKNGEFLTLPSETWIIGFGGSTYVGRWVFTVRSNWLNGRYTSGNLHHTIFTAGWDLGFQVVHSGMWRVYPYLGYQLGGASVSLAVLGLRFIDGGLAVDLDLPRTESAALGWSVGLRLGYTQSLQRRNASGPQFMFNVGGTVLNSRFSREDTQPQIHSMQGHVYTGIGLYGFGDVQTLDIDDTTTVTIPNETLVFGIGGTTYQNRGVFNVGLQWMQTRSHRGVSGSGLVAFPSVGWVLLRRLGLTIYPLVGLGLGVVQAFHPASETSEGAPVTLLHGGVAFDYLFRPRAHSDRAWSVGVRFGVTKQAFERSARTIPQELPLGAMNGLNVSIHVGRGIRGGGFGCNCL